MSYRNENPECKVYVGDLSSQATKQDLEEAFSYYGPLRNVWVARNPPGFAFVEFEDIRDAEDAIKEIDGRRTVCGRKVRVERADKRKEGGSRFRRSSRDDRRFGNGSGPMRRGGPGMGGRPFNPDDRCYECGDRGHYARDCRDRQRGGNRGFRDRTRRKRSYSSSRSRSPHSRSGSRKGGRSRSRSKGSNKRSRSPRDRRSRSKSYGSPPKSKAKYSSSSPNKNTNGSGVMSPD